MDTIALQAGQFGDLLLFTVYSYASAAVQSVTPMNLTSTVVTLLTNDGVQRATPIQSALSGVVGYVTSQGEFQRATVYTARLRVSFADGSRAYTYPPFVIHVQREAHLE